VRNFALAGNCGIPAFSNSAYALPVATCYSLNVTVVPKHGLGYLTMWPAGQRRPLGSLLNSDGRIKANAAIVAAGSNGEVSVYTSDDTDLIIDVNGYFGWAISGYRYVP